MPRITNGATPSTGSVSCRRAAIAGALPNCKEQTGCQHQIWSAMNSDERSQFGSKVALNKFMQEQARMYSSGAWLTASILPCCCERGPTAALHGARYSAHAGRASWDKMTADRQEVLRAEFAKLPVATDGAFPLH